MIPTRKSLLLLITVLVLSIQVFAHPGKTDSNGGHTNHDTGSYHYHHGYEAHSHYDMDGDGVIDCPYDFEDNVKHDRDYVSSGSSGLSKNYYWTDPTDVPISTTQKKEAVEVPSWVYWTFGILFLLIIILLLAARSKRNRIWELESQNSELKSTIDDLNHNIKKQDEEIVKIYQSEQKWKAVAEHATKRAEGMVAIREKENSMLMERLANLQSERDDLLRIIPTAKTSATLDDSFEPIDIPKEIYFVRGNIPVKGIVSDSMPFGDFTVFTSRMGKKYHVDEFCGGYICMDAVHLYDVLGKKTPCYKCAITSPHRLIKEAPPWYEKIKALPVIPKKEQAEHLDQFANLYTDPTLKVNWRD